MDAPKRIHIKETSIMLKPKFADIVILVLAAIAALFHLAETLLNQGNAPSIAIKSNKALSNNPNCLSECSAMFVSGEQPMSGSATTTWSYCHCDYLFCNQTATINKTTCHWSTFAIDVVLASLGETACNRAHVQELQLDKFWSLYRLKDYISGYMIEREPSRNARVHKSLYKNSLATAFHRTMVDHNISMKSYPNFEVSGIKLELFYRLVKARMLSSSLEQGDIAHPKTLVIHVRLGDVVDTIYPESVRDMLSEYSQGNPYVKPLSYYYYKAVEIAKNHDVKSIVLMGGAHGKLFLRATKSCQFIKVLQVFLTRGLPQAKVSLRVGHNPDDDVVFATSADYFIPSGGGYSRLLGDLQKLRVEEASLNKNGSI